MRVVTAGPDYIDIDAYGGIVAYSELLRLQGHESLAVSTAPLNESISKTVRSWKAPLLTKFTARPNDTFTMVDVSNPDYFDKVVVIDKVEEIIDHHLGFERYWQDRIGDNSHIEFIGAACSLVYERWKMAGIINQMSVTSARLLVCGILDNTLNFAAKVTTKRDKDAYGALLPRADLPKDWPTLYFKECQDGVLSNVVRAVQNDTKTLSFRSFSKPVSCGQLVVWDASQLLSNNTAELTRALKAVQPDWFLNLIAVGERKSYFVSDNPNVQNWLADLLGLRFDGSVATANRLWLRKEITGLDIKNHESSSLL